MGILSSSITVPVSIIDEIAAANGSFSDLANLRIPMFTPDGFLAENPISELERMMPYILGLCETMTVGNRYDYLPDFLSYDLYGTHDLWPLLLVINAAPSRADFHGPVVNIVRVASASLLAAALRATLTAVTTIIANKPPVANGDLTIKAIYQ